MDEGNSKGSVALGLKRPKMISRTAASLAPKLATRPAQAAAISGMTAGRSRWISTMVGVRVMIDRRRLFSGSLKSRSPAWKKLSRKMSFRGAKGALKRRMAISAALGSATSSP